MEWSNILTLIREGEGSRVEFKQIPFLTDSKKIAEQLVSFANTHGGRILVGVKNDKTLEHIKIDYDTACQIILNVGLLTVPLPTAGANVR